MNTETCYACEEAEGVILGYVQGDPFPFCHECHDYEYGPYVLKVKYTKE